MSEQIGGYQCSECGADPESDEDDLATLRADLATAEARVAELTEALRAPHEAKSPTQKIDALYNILAEYFPGDDAGTARLKSVEAILRLELERRATDYPPPEIEPKYIRECRRYKGEIRTSIIEECISDLDGRGYEPGYNGLTPSEQLRKLDSGPPGKEPAVSAAPKPPTPGK